MNRKVKTIERTAASDFDVAINGFIAKDYVASPKVTFNPIVSSAYGPALYIAHIEYIDVRQ